MSNQLKKEIQIEINNDILKYIYPNSNDIISKMSNNDKLYAIYLIKQYYLTLRNKLNINKEATFGLEIEFDDVPQSIIETEINTSKIESNWKVKADGSLPNGGEIISPILKDEERTWKELKKICNIVSNYGLESEQTGAHIHIGMHILGNNPKYWRNFSLLWMTYENILFRFLNGEYITPRPNILSQAKPIAEDLINIQNKLEEKANIHTAFYIIQTLDKGLNESYSFQSRRKRSVNFTNLSAIEPYKYNKVENKNTIEFRSPNGTFNEVVWQNNVNLLIKLLEYAKRSDFNEELIRKRLQIILNTEIPSNLRKYSYIYTDEALELADLIFTNNLDKIYFLRQYFKNGEVSTKEYTKVRTFTK